MLTHLGATYGSARDYRVCMELVEKQFNAPYNKKTPIEEYFMKLEETCDNAEALEQKYTTKQMINKATGQFVKQYGKDGTKTEDKWDGRPANEKNWTNFKIHWKTAVHRFESANRHEQRAHQAIVDQVGSLAGRMHDMQVDMSAMQTETRGYQGEAHALHTMQTRMREAHQARQDRSSSDELSALTDAVTRIDGLEQRMNTRIDTLIASLGQRTNGDQPSHTTRIHDATAPECPATTDLLCALAGKPPDHYKALNSGKGLMFKKYCWKCGCTCTHWTRNCPYLSTDLRTRYSKANFRNTMGGSNTNIDRKGQFQADFNFDSF